MKLYSARDDRPVAKNFQELTANCNSDWKRRVQGKAASKLTEWHIHVIPSVSWSGESSNWFAVLLRKNFTPTKFQQQNITFIDISGPPPLNVCQTYRYVS